MRARGLASRERRQFANEDDLILAREAKTGGHFVETTEPNEVSADVMRLPTLSVKLKDLVELR
jgi:hypothetical protein